MILLPAFTHPPELDKIYNCSAENLLTALPDNSIHCIVTSPPYFGLRDYGMEGQIGLEETPSEFVAKLVAVFRECRRVLREDGTLWLNLGDSYASAKSRFSSSPQALCGKSRGEPTARNKPDLRAHGWKDKQLIGIPWRVAFALQDDDWILRSEIIWEKPNCLPESVTDRPTKAHETIFMFAKSPRYYYDADAIREPFSDVTLPRMLRGVSESHKNANGAPGQPKHTLARARSNRKHDGTTHGSNGSGFSGHSGYFREDGTPLVNPLGRNKRSVWTVATQPFSGAHFATFPPKLIEPMILAGCPVGGVVLDPFMGSGTTGLVARNHGRHYLGSELNPDYCQLARQRLRKPFDPHVIQHETKLDDLPLFATAEHDSLA